MTRTQMLREILDQVISDDVRPVLRERGFTKRRWVFRRQRGPIYDELSISGNKWNGINDFYTFSVSVGVGSTEIDELSGVHSPPELYGHLVSNLYRLIPDLQNEMSFDETYDVEIWGAVLCDELERVVDVIDRFDSSRGLAVWAVANNGLHDYEKTCGYLAAIGDTDTLVGYVRTLQSEFGHEDRWEFFSRKIVAVVGSAAVLLEQQGLVGDIDESSRPLQFGTNMPPVDLDR